jgi:hypothetical protein
MGACCIATRGMICCTSRRNIYTSTDDHPLTTAVVEVRPQLRSVTSQTTPPEPAGIPVVLAAVEMKPVMVRGDGPPPSGPPQRPRVLSAEDLRPVIVEAEEE